MSVGAKLLDVQLQEEMAKPRPPSRPLSTTMAESIASLESSTMSQVLPSFIWQFNHEFWADGWYFIISDAFHLPQLPWFQRSVSILSNPIPSTSSSVTGDQSVNQQSNEVLEVNCCLFNESSLVPE